MTCGSNHTLVTTVTGEVFSWGEARFGALGIHGASFDQFSPQQVSLSDQEEIPIVMVSAGKKHSLFLDSNGRIYSCGSNDKG